MSPIKRGNIFYLYVPKQKGGWVLRTTGTSERRVYTLMKALVDRLKANRRWALLAAVIDGTLTLGQLYDADRTKGLDALEASLSAKVLAPHATAYLKDCGTRGLAARNIENIKRQLTSFLAYRPEDWEGEGPLTTADMTAAFVTAWLGSLASSPGTRRQYLFAVTGLARYLVGMEVLADYPLSRVKAPKKNSARMRYETEENDERIVRATRADVRGLSAFVKSTGVDLSVAIDTPVRNIDLSRLRARLSGTKTAQRDVHKALIEPWGVPYIRESLRGLLPDAKPWAHTSRSVAAKQHAAACKAVGVTGYTLKDSRHSVAVRMMEQGYTVQEIAEQLGNSPELVARCYSQHVPKMDRRVKEGDRANG